jgi:hypothetical protein
LQEYVGVNGYIHRKLIHEQYINIWIILTIWIWIIVLRKLIVKNKVSKLRKLHMHNVYIYKWKEHVIYNYQFFLLEAVYFGFKWTIKFVKMGFTLNLLSFKEEQRTGHYIGAYYI